MRITTGRPSLCWGGARLVNSSLITIQRNSSTCFVSIIYIGAVKHANDAQRCTERLNWNTSILSLFTYIYVHMAFIIPRRICLFSANNTCKTTNLTTDDNNLLFGNLQIAGGIHVFSTNGAIHFAQKYGQVNKNWLIDWLIDWLDRVSRRIDSISAM